jgi:Mn-dependent DtxR family transcriptional regulator
MQVRASAEDYLETILLLTRKSRSVRSIDVVAEMGYSKPSISIAMKKLREDGFVVMDEEGFIKLTPAGHEVASNVYDRHSTLYAWLVSNGVAEETAQNDACRMEHIISDETFAAIKRLVRASSN